MPHASTTCQLPCNTANMAGCTAVLCLTRASRFACSHTAFQLHCALTRAEGLHQEGPKAIQVNVGVPSLAQVPKNPCLPFSPVLSLWWYAGKSSPVSWMRMLLIMKEYCHRYSRQPDEDQEQPQQARQDCLVPPEDVAGLSAFLRLFSQVCSASVVVMLSVLSLMSDCIFKGCA